MVLHPQYSITNPLRKVIFAKKWSLLQMKMGEKPQNGLFEVGLIFNIQ